MVEHKDAVTRPDGAELLYRPAGRASAQNAAFSPDGNALVFTQFDAGYNLGGASLWLLRTSGGPPEVLVRKGGQAAVNLPGAAWNKPTGLIAFSYDVTDLDEIWTIAPGSAPTRVTTHDRIRGYTEPSFAPDGEWIVFQDNDIQTGPGARGSIWKVRRADGLPIELVDGPGTDTDNRQPNWSPRGDRIVFQSRRADSADWDLVTIAPDGTGRATLTAGADEDTDASFSPDGNWVVYSSDHAHTPHAQIFARRADGTGLPVRVTTSEHYDGAPSWSPDGRWITFESSADGESATALWRIPTRILG
ncbi:PD40 domain-containing protein [Nocardia brasiliensis]|uniref:PD40 domain-containing protein n=1 Tax=Nocardia brasiliensis TaxID=37326 RepID=UPI0018937749|nr:PD40 domain-containing protein [Nocardia brasiliensis]MBF6130287.1 PD40 domain-containing protein [Nocardia brasiliensis]